MSEIDYHKLRGRITAGKLVRASVRDGFYFDGGAGSHRQYRHSDGRLVTVTYHHSGDTFSSRLLKSMIEVQARWTLVDLKRLKLVPKRGL
jgi:predicted RNA binding protein YcfA (HicA-like mRNA interferase family)